jgi:hypothetical protein
MQIIFQLDDVPEADRKPLHVSGPCVRCRKAGEKVIKVREALAHIVDAPCLGDPNECEVYIAGECDGEQDSETCRAGLYITYHVCSECVRYGDVFLFCRALSHLVGEELFAMLPNIASAIAKGHEVVVNIETRPRQGAGGDV